MTVLATDADVAKALGLSNAASMSSSQKERVAGELARVTSVWERAAGRSWVAGPVRVQTVSVGGWITLPDLPTDEAQVFDRDGNPVNVLVDDGDQLKVGVILGDGVSRTLPSGTIVNVEYTAGDVPAGVAYSVASIVARRLGVEPGSPETKFTELTAGADYRAKGASWVSSTEVLTESEKQEARAYRPLPGTVIVARWN